MQLHLGGRDLNVYISSASGLWLHLVKTSSNVEETNLQFLLSSEINLCLTRGSSKKGAYLGTNSVLKEFI